jgi:hypothetical protein
MQFPPIVFSDISLLFAVGAIVILIVFEVGSPYLGKTNLILDRKKLKNAGLILSILFLITFVITTYNLLIGL